MFQLETLVTTSLTSLLPEGIRPKDLVYSPGKLNLVVHACNPGLGRIRPEDQPKCQGILSDIKKKLSLKQNGIKQATGFCTSVNFKPIKTNKTELEKKKLSERPLDWSCCQISPKFQLF